MPIFLIEVKSNDQKYEKHFVYKAGSSFQEAIGFMTLTRWPYRYNPVIRVTLINQYGENKIVYEADENL